MRRASSGTKGLSIVDTWGKGRPRDRKRFLCRVKVPGTQTYQGKRFDTRPAAEAWGDALLAGLKAGTETADQAYLDVVATEYCKQLREGDGVETASEGYVRHIELVVAGLVKAGIRDMKAKTFGAAVRSWVAGLKPNWWAKPDCVYRKTGGKPLSNTLRNRILREVRSLCSYAVATRRMIYGALDGAKGFRVEKHLKATFSLDEMRAIVSDRNRADPWWLPACLAVYTGCRIQEAMHLRWQDIDWKSRTVYVRLQDEYRQKNDTEREVPLQEELRAILQPMAKTTGFIIESELMRSNGTIHEKERKKTPHPDYTPAFCRYLRRIHIKPGDDAQKRTAHSLRHCWVALMLASGSPSKLVAAWAGHGPTVQDSYASAIDRFGRQAVNWPRGDFHLRREIAAVLVAPVVAAAG